ncbi:MAG: heme NO-binding domain-containing protein [Myxococcales bacterium]|nr:heme NO-binding domain-containing protein [Myxococcales bacterium]
MKGLVFSEFIDMVEERFGGDVLERVIEAADLPSGGVYSSIGTYDFSEMAALVGGLSEQTGVAGDALIRFFGEHLFARLVDLYPKFLAGEKSTMDFVPKVENYIHHEVRKLYPDADLPAFHIRERTEDKLVFIYESPRPLSDMAEGMLLGCFRHFEEAIELTREELPRERGAKTKFTLIKQTSPGAEAPSPTLFRPIATAPPATNLSGGGPGHGPGIDEGGLDRTLGHLKSLLLQEASREGGSEASAEIDQTLTMLRTVLVERATGVVAPARTPATSDEIEQLTAQLRRAQQARRASESIAEQKTREIYAAKQQLENTLSYLRAILDNMDDGLMVVSLEQEIRLINRRAQHLLALKTNELVGVPIGKLLDERLVSLIQSCSEKTDSSAHRMDYTSPRGHLLSIVASAIRSADSVKHIGTVLIARDISNEVEAQKHRSITDMVVGVAHELNTPLGIIKTAVGVITDAAKSEAFSSLEDEAAQDELDAMIDAGGLIETHATRMGRLIEAFKKLSASQTSEELTEIDLPDLLHEIAQVTSSRHDRLDVQLAVDLPRAQRMWEGYPEHLMQVITALLVNAVEHAYESDAATCPVRLALSRDDSRDRFIIRVKDFGIGISEERKGRIFDAFFTSKRGGGAVSLGLGLSIVHNLVRSVLRGTIEVESEEHEGAMFTVTVPTRLR